MPPLRFVDVVRECDDGKRVTQDPWAWKRIAVHRIWFDDWPLDRPDTTPLEIALRFRDDAEIVKYTGGEIPYSFLVEPDSGDWWQCLSLSDVGRHAKRWSFEALGVGVIGDFRKRPPSLAQRTGLVEGLSLLCRAFGIDPLGVEGGVPLLAGHDELPGGSKDPTKRCTGPYLPMIDLRRDVANEISRPAQISLTTIGVVA